MRPRRLVSYAFLYTTQAATDNFLLESDNSFLNFLNFSRLSYLEFWWAENGKSGISMSISGYSNSSFSKNTAFNSCIDVWIDSFILLDDSYTELSLFPLNWNLVWLETRGGPCCTCIFQSHNFPKLPASNLPIRSQSRLLWLIWVSS